MKKFLIIYAVVATLLLTTGAILLYCSHREADRLRNNNQTLTSKTQFYQSRLGESAASVSSLELKLDEYREQHARDVKRIKALGIRLRRVESTATAATKSEVTISVPRIDTVVLTKDLLLDTLSLFCWSDHWVNIEGEIRGDSVKCRVESVDTLRQVIHRVPRRFLFFNIGTKAIRQEITSSNPHSRIVYAEYIELPQRRKRR